MKKILAIALLVSAFAWAQPPQLGGIFKKKSSNTQKQDDKNKQQQQNKDQNDNNNNDSNDKNKTDNNGQQPLFQGNVNATSSKQTSDTTAMGFSGLNPDGTVESAAMNAQPNSSDYANAQKVARYHVDKSKLSDFIEQGKLKKKGGQ
jgi:hypothetical protein